MTKDAAETRCAKVFIVGVGRSGTSLVQSMLASHSRLAFASETAFVRRFVARRRLRTVFETDGAAAVAQQLENDEYFGRTGIAAGPLVAGVNARGAVTDAAIYRAMLRFQAETSGKPYAGDKDPRCIEFLGLLRDLLPEAHVVQVIRDPRDVLLSRKRAAWSRDKNVVMQVFIMHVQTELGATTGPQEFGARYHEVVYEHLLQDPEGVMTKLCKLLAIDYEPGMLGFSRAAQRLVAENEMSWKKETLGTLLKDNTGKWEKGLSAWEIALVEACVPRPFARGLYEKRGASGRLPWFGRQGVKLVGVLVRMLAPFYMGYRRLTVERARKSL